MIPPVNSPNISIFIGYHPLIKSNPAMSIMRGGWKTIPTLKMDRCSQGQPLDWEWEIL